MQDKRLHPKVWMSLHPGGLDLDEAFRDMKSHGVDVADFYSPVPNRAEALELARKHQLRLSWVVPDIVWKHISQFGHEPVPAVMIGGAYKGRAIDWHTFPFSPGDHEIEIERPVNFFPQNEEMEENLSRYGRFFQRHFYGVNPQSVKRAEVIVKKCCYNGKQHLTLLPAEIIAHDEKHVRIGFSLSGQEGDLEHVMIAVYWPSDEEVSPAAHSTKEALSSYINSELDAWADANGGKFPEDVIVGMRYGDEMFLHTGFVNDPSASIPLYDYSESGIQEYRKLNRHDEYPRMWAWPEVYGTNAYRDWMYSYHRSTAELLRIVREVIHNRGLNIAVFRNITRFNPATFATLYNDHDGSGNQLLVEQLDIVCPDPYPVAATMLSQAKHPDREPKPGYIETIIPLEGSYFSGLAHRLGNAFMPWMQGHSYVNDLQHPSPEQIKKMFDQTIAFNPDGIMWLAYSRNGTFPKTRPDSWKEAEKVHRRVHGQVREDPARPLAVLRFYAERSLVEPEENQLQDRILTERLLTSLTVDLKVRYDIFEIYRREDVDFESLKGYDAVLLYVMDVEDLDLKQLAQCGPKVILICCHESSLAQKRDYTGVRSLEKIEGHGPFQVNISGHCVHAKTVYKARLDSTTKTLGRCDGQPCAWGKGNIRFVSFLPSSYDEDAIFLKSILR